LGGYPEQKERWAKLTGLSTTKGRRRKNRFGTQRARYGVLSSGVTTKGAGGKGTKNGLSFGGDWGEPEDGLRPRERDLEFLISPLDAEKKT